MKYISDTSTRVGSKGYKTEIHISLMYNEQIRNISRFLEKGDDNEHRSISYIL